MKFVDICGHRFIVRKNKDDVECCKKCYFSYMKDGKICYYNNGFFCCAYDIKGSYFLEDTIINRIRTYLNL